MHDRYCLPAGIFFSVFWLGLILALDCVLLDVWIGSRTGSSSGRWSLWLGWGLTGFLTSTSGVILLFQELVQGKVADQQLTCWSGAAGRFAGFLFDEVKSLTWNSPAGSGQDDPYLGFLSNRLTGSITADLLGVSGYGLICHARVRWRVSSPCPSFHSSNLCPASWIPEHSRPGCKLAEMLRHLVWLASVLQILSLWLHVLFSLCLPRSKALLLRRGVVIGMRAAVVEALHSLVVSLIYFFFLGCRMHIALCVLACRHPALHIQFAGSSE
ncbi:hypothetical protein Nepgr_023151 [Nepenthes gracilis]|uniref:Uncharacterized protein n=1 Tax=Nepenthes gracilis TaxID=150966 RepID=A0AAD3T296_NEPGR|nr:hypothetical protein Nepgr_023151 [Nepenthes gracilis]